MTLATITSEMLVSTDAMATSQDKMDGQMTIRTPKTMKASPGINIVSPEMGFSIMPLQVSAIGQVGRGVGCVILLVLGLQNCALT